MEDDQTVLAMVRSLLAGRGYTVIGTHDPLQALRLAADNRIDLLVTDVVMPGMSGPDLCRRLLEDSPRAESALHVRLHRRRVARHVEFKEGVNFIQKPFAVEALERARSRRYRRVSALWRPGGGSFTRP